MNGGEVMKSTTGEIFNFKADYFKARAKENAIKSGKRLNDYYRACGLQPSTVCTVCNAKSSLRVETLVKMARAARCSPLKLIEF